MKVGSVRIVDGWSYPTVSIEFHRTRDGVRVVEALLDSGFNGAVSLPANVVERLGLPLVTERAATLADGSDIKIKVHVGYVRFAARRYRCAVWATGDVPMIGMHLLQGFKVCFEAFEGGVIEIERSGD